MKIRRTATLDKAVKLFEEKSRIDGCVVGLYRHGALIDMKSDTPEKLGLKQCEKLQAKYGAAESASITKMNET